MDRGGKEDLLLTALYFKLFSGGVIIQRKLLLSIFSGWIQFLNISASLTIRNGTSVRQAGRLSGLVDKIFPRLSKKYFCNFIKEYDLCFYFQNEKDQILTTNIWLNLVSMFLSLPRILRSNKVVRQ